MGDYVLSLEDLIEGRRFPDAVCMGGYHMDIHRPSGTWVESRNVKAYTIPLRSLIAHGVEGLMMAGKCFSGTHEALASTRVVTICMGQGQAVGTAAALAVCKGTSVHDVDVSALQTALMDQGAELGQTLDEPDPEVMEQVGQFPLDEPLTTGDRDEAFSDNSAWVDGGKRS